MVTLRNLLMLAMLTVVFTACDTNELTGPDDSADTSILENFLTAANWTATLDGGTADVRKSGDALILRYDVTEKLDNSRNHRITKFEMHADFTGTLSFDWEYSGNHGLAFAAASLENRGTRSDVLVDEQQTVGSFIYTGTGSMVVRERQRFVLLVGARSSRHRPMQGTVKLTNIRVLP